MSWDDQLQRKYPKMTGVGNFAVDIHAVEHAANSVMCDCRPELGFGESDFAMTGAEERSALVERSIHADYETAFHRIVHLVFHRHTRPDRSAHQNGPLGRVWPRTTHVVRGHTY